jgi:hypothetical protein
MFMGPCIVNGSVHREWVRPSWMGPCIVNGSVHREWVRASWMGPCIVNGSVHRESMSIIVQQDATIYNFIIFLKNSSTCFGWYLHLSSGAHVKCNYSIWQWSNRICYRPLSWRSVICIEVSRIWKRNFLSNLGSIEFHSRICSAPIRDDRTQGTLCLTEAITEPVKMSWVFKKRLSVRRT